MFHLSKVSWWISSVFVVVVFIFSTLEYIKYKERESVKTEQRLDELETERRTNEAVRNAPTTLDDIREWLRGRVEGSE